MAQGQDLTERSRGTVNGNRLHMSSCNQFTFRCRSVCPALTLILSLSRSVVMFTFGIVVFLECFSNLSNLHWDLQRRLTDSVKPEEEVCFFYAVVAVCESSLCDRKVTDKTERNVSAVTHV